MPVPPKKIVPAKPVRMRFVKQAFSHPAAEGTARAARSVAGKNTTTAIPIYTPREPQSQPAPASPDQIASTQPQSSAPSFFSNFFTTPKILLIAAALLAAAAALTLYFLR
jgi:hypothetical protein